MRALVAGASGGLGAALAAQLAADPRVTHVTAWSRSGTAANSAALTHAVVDISDEATIASAALDLGEIDIALVATGLLHDAAANIHPEKTWRALDPGTMRRSFEINTIGPALIAKHVLPRLPRDRRAVFAVLSARVGSISDNRSGGWYSYRASKAALNQVVRCLSIELAPRWPQAICVGLHPGTVDTDLSKPFQGNVADGKLFTAAESARHLLAVIDQLQPAQSGRVFDWAGVEVPA
jgi:NAD(P)-dependent dehydrogenase (short-subunit alcohol dehydrogenase family)